MESRRINGKINFLDKVISTVSPGWAEKRARSRAAITAFSRARAAMDSAYDAGSVMDPIFQEWYPPTDRHPEQDLPSEAQKIMVARCKDSYRNICISKAVVDRLREHSIGLGLKLQSRVDAETLGLSREEGKELNKKIEKRFHATASSEEIDYERSLNFYELQDLILLGMLLSGDVFVNTQFLNRPGGLCKTKIQVIDGSRVGNPSGGIDSKTLRKGIYLDAVTGAPTHIYVYDEDPLIGRGMTGKFYSIFGKETGRRRVFFVLEKEYIGFARGIPLLANILKIIKQAGRYIDSEILAAVISSYFTVFIKKKSGEASEYDLPVGQGEATTTSTGAKQIRMGPGMVNVIDDNEISFANPTRPNPQTKDFLYLLLTMIGASTGVPVELFMMNFTTSFWAARASLNAFWHRVQKYRSIIANRFCIPYYRLWIDEEIASGRLEIAAPYSDPMVRAAFRSHWEGPCRDAINENQQALAVQARLDAKISTRQREAEQLVGLDFEDVLDQLEYEEAEMTRRGITTEKPAKSAAVIPDSEVVSDSDNSTDEDENEEEVLDAQTITS